MNDIVVKNCRDVTITNRENNGLAKDSNKRSIKNWLYLVSIGFVPLFLMFVVDSCRRKDSTFPQNAQSAERVVMNIQTAFMLSPANAVNASMKSDKMFDESELDQYAISELNVWASKFIDEHKYELSFKICEQAAIKGDPVAQYNLANMYYQGLGVRQSDKQYFIWCRKAADQGLPEALFNLGISYYRAIGTERNIRRAAQCIRDSADKGYANAQSLLGYIYVFGAGFGLETDYGRALVYMRRSAEQGFPLAYFQLGWMYAVGLGCESDFEKAHYWLKKAEDSDDKDVKKIAKEMIDTLIQYSNSSKKNASTVESGS